MAEILERPHQPAGHRLDVDAYYRMAEAGILARAAADGLVLVSGQNPLRLDRFNEPEPDLMLLRPRADVYRASHPSAADVHLLVEVSDTSLTYDRGTKLARAHGRLDGPRRRAADMPSPYLPGRLRPSLATG
jgi:hypothetical protein